MQHDGIVKLVHEVAAADVGRVERGAEAAAVAGVTQQDPHARHKELNHLRVGAAARACACGALGAGCGHSGVVASRHGSCRRTRELLAEKDRRDEDTGAFPMMNVPQFKRSIQVVGMALPHAPTTVVALPHAFQSPV
eukprot:77488-Chlamydomonas_euryale.AAC.2